MGQAIAGVVPDTEREVTVMETWPTLAATSYGRWWGRRYEGGLGRLKILGVPAIALLSIPLILPLYFHMLVPRLPFVVWGFPNPWCRKYRLTNRRVVVEQPFGGGELQSVSLDRFDAVDIDMLPGQAWYPAGDLVFRTGPVETFRLSGVSRPESFRQTCLKAHVSFIGVKDARLEGWAV
ncbi:MAG: PH domain-containing protein [Planctomycetota bacterium]